MPVIDMVFVFDVARNSHAPEMFARGGVIGFALEQLRRITETAMSTTIGTIRFIGQQLQLRLEETRHRVADRVGLPSQRRELEIMPSESSAARLTVR